MKSNFLPGLVSIGLAATLCSIRLASAQEAAVVLENRVNVRGQPTLNSEVLTQLRQGERVTILEEIPGDKLQSGEPMRWARIAMPTNVHVWVHSRFIDSDTKLVKANRLNARSGAGENFSIVGRLELGAPVAELSNKDGWIEIEPPANAYAFVAAELLTKEGSSTPIDSLAGSPRSVSPSTTALDTPPPSLKPPPETPTEITNVATTTEQSVPPTTVQPNEQVTAIPATSPTTLEESAPLIRVRDEPSTQVAFAPPESTRDQRDQFRTGESTPTVIPTLIPGGGQPGTKRMVRREGTISRTVSVQAPTHYELQSMENGKTMNYLYATAENLSFRGLVGKKVFATGQEVVDKRWPSVPVLEVETIELLP